MLEALLSGGVTSQFLVCKSRNDGVRNYKKNKSIYFITSPSITEVHLMYLEIQHHALHALRRPPLLIGTASYRFV